MEAVSIGVSIGVSAGRKVIINLHLKTFGGGKMMEVKTVLKFEVELSFFEGGKPEYKTFPQLLKEEVKKKKNEILFDLVFHFLKGGRWDNWGFQLNGTDYVIYLKDYELSLKDEKIQGWIELDWDLL
jgi:hypothetical protein